MLFSRIMVKCDGCGIEQFFLRSHGWLFGDSRPSSKDYCPQCRKGHET